MKYQSIILILLLAALLSGCRKDASVKIKQDGAAVSVTIPADASAADLITLQTALSNSLTIKAERERMAFELESAKLRKSERQFYAVLIVGGVVFGIVTVFSIACFIVVKRVGGAKI